MAISVGFTNLSKRENSTKQLTMSVTHDCTFKNGCSLLNPTLLLEIDSDSFPDYTAFKIENRYYNVRDIRSVRNNLFEITGEIDVLATYKDNIKATTAYIIYDSTNNTEIPDNRLPMKTTASVSKAESSSAPLEYDTDGTYILSLTGSHGTTGIYKVTRAQMQSLIDDVNDVKDNIFDNDPTPDPLPTYPQSPTLEQVLQYWGQVIMWNFNQITHWIDALKKTVSQFFGTGSIPENIRECRWLPFDIGTSYSVNDIYLGTFETREPGTQHPIRLGKLNTETVVKIATVDIPWPTETVGQQQVAISDYRRRSPYTEIYLYIPYIGMTKLSSENLVGQSSITVKYAIALRDGSVSCTVESGDQILGQYPGNVGASVPIGFSNINAPKAAQQLISAIQQYANNNYGNTAMAAISFGETITPNYTCIGGLDGIAGVATPQKVVCYTVFHDTNVAPNSQLQTIGSPTMAPKSLANLQNYVQTLSASVDGAMTSDERTKLNTLLDNGIFIE